MTLVLIRSASAQEGILIAYGDHIELVCEDNGLISVTHTILETANVTQNVTSASTYSIKGTLVGTVKGEYDPEIREPDILYKSENGITTIIVNFSVTLAPLKFVKLKLSYELSDMLKYENETWHLRYTFNSDATSPPEIVVKVPKPSQFDKLVVENTVPSPNVLMEESHYYSLVYKTPLFKFGNTSATSIDITYRSEFDFDAFKWWILLQVLGWAIAFPLGFSLERIWRLRIRQTKKNSAFEIFRDKEGKFRFRLKTANGEIIAISEAYETKQGCENGMASVKTNAPMAKKVYV
jgi:hypothetical protein